MMKRRSSILMILLANMLILAHAVVPHHHHNKMFVAIVNVLDDEAQDLFNDEHGHEHHHDGDSDHHEGPAHHHDGDTEDCLMSEAEAAAALKMETEDDGGWTIRLTPSPSPNGGGSDCSQGGKYLRPSPLGEGSGVRLSIPIFSEDTIRRRPYVASGHTDFVARSKGLRAPPAC